MSPKAKREYYYMMHMLLFVMLFGMGKFMLYDPYIKNNDHANSQLTASASNAIDTEIVNSQKLTFVAVGDIMMHQSQMSSGYDKKSGTYNFDNFFINIKPFLSGDIVYANLETPVAGKELKYGGYPNFNSPIELLGALKNSYFTHLSLANNHALDRGTKGILNTVKNVTDFGFTALGARSDNTKANYEITEKNGLHIGFVSYAYGTNGHKISNADSYMLSYINKDQIKKDLYDLKSQGVDVTFAAFHFGEEYKLNENKSQQDLAKFVCDLGVDVVIGSHPHVLEPITYLNDGKCLVAYSLGNFISGMSKEYTDLGGILKVEISKENNVITINPDFIGTWVKRSTDTRGVKMFTVVPLDIDKIPSTIAISKVEAVRLEKYRNFVNTKIKTYVKKP